MVKIRLTRTGRKNAPAYRIVAIESTKKVNGKPLEVLGFYNPTEDPKKYKCDKARYDYWVSKGAQVSSAVIKILKGTYVFEPYTRQNEKKAGSGDAEIGVTETKKTPGTEAVEDVKPETIEEESVQVESGEENNKKVEEIQVESESKEKITEKADTGEEKEADKPEKKAPEANETETVGSKTDEVKTEGTKTASLEPSVVKKSK